MIIERLRGRLEAWLLRVWFGEAGGLDRLLALLAAPVALPLSWLVAWSARRRRGRIRHQPRGTGADGSPPVPVVVVGNLVVGGTGKTPLVAALAHGLAERGFRPGLLARGYRGNGASDRDGGGPVVVTARSDPAEAGDEAVLLAELTGLPLVAGRDRAAALATLVARYPDRDVILSDDGLQHVGLPRRLELLVFDERGLGNGRCLPAGPLREPADRVATVDAVVLTAGHDDAPGTGATPIPRFRSRIEATGFCTLDGAARWAPAAFADRFGRDRLAAIAGIARPARFFGLLGRLGLTVDPHPLPDHARIDRDWLAALPGRWIVMTAKDAAKCRGLPPALAARCVCLHIAAVPDDALLEWLAAALRDHDRLPRSG